jgi:hypothetical protein
MKVKIKKNGPEKDFNEFSINLKFESERDCVDVITMLDWLCYDFLTKPQIKFIEKMKETILKSQGD